MEYLLSPLRTRETVEGLTFAISAISLIVIRRFTVFRIPLCKRLRYYNYMLFPENCQAPFLKKYLLFENLQLKLAKLNAPGKEEGWHLVLQSLCRRKFIQQNIPGRLTEISVQPDDGDILRSIRHFL